MTLCVYVRRGSSFALLQVRIWGQEELMCQSSTNVEWRIEAGNFPSMCMSTGLARPLALKCLQKERKIIKSGKIMSYNLLTSTGFL